jgi:polysaccharide deacetylase 2 family uncharacterized protein YibQ
MVGIVVDDFGYNGAMAREFAELEIPLTWSIIPGGRNGKSAEDRGRKEHSYMIHLPMQAVTDVKGSRLYKEAGSREGMTPEEIRSAVLRSLEELPDAVALNNHRGSLSTASAELMGPLMDVLQEKGIPFVDSRTIGNSVAFATARARGLPLLYNSIFLDHEVDDKFMRKQMNRAISHRRRRGWVVVICHIRPHTLAYLKSLASEKFDTVEFVTIPKLFGAVKPWEGRRCGIVQGRRIVVFPEANGYNQMSCPERHRECLRVSEMCFPPCGPSGGSRGNPRRNGTCLEKRKSSLVPSGATRERGAWWTPWRIGWIW